MTTDFKKIADVKALFEGNKTLSDVENSFEPMGSLLLNAVSQGASLDVVEYLIRIESDSSNREQKKDYTASVLYESCKNCDASVVKYLSEQKPEIVKNEEKLSECIELIARKIETEGDKSKDAKIVLGIFFTQCKDIISERNKLLMSSFISDIQNVETQKNLSQIITNIVDTARLSQLPLGADSKNETRVKKRKIIQPTERKPGESNEESDIGLPSYNPIEEKSPDTDLDNTSKKKTQVVTKRRTLKPKLNKSGDSTENWFSDSPIYIPIKRNPIGNDNNSSNQDIANRHLGKRTKFEIFSFDYVQELFKNNDSLSVIEKSFEPEDNKSYMGDIKSSSLLLNAVSQGANLDVVKYLIEKGSDSSIKALKRNYETSVLFEACKNCDASVAMFLLFNNSKILETEENPSKLLPFIANNINPNDDAPQNAKNLLAILLAHCKDVFLERDGLLNNKELFKNRNEEDSLVLRTTINDIADIAKNSQKFSIKKVQELFRTPEDLTPELLEDVFSKGITLDAISHLVEEKIFNPKDTERKLFLAAYQSCDISVVKYLHQKNPELLKSESETMINPESCIFSAYSNLCKNPKGSHEASVLELLLGESNDIYPDRNVMLSNKALIMIKNEATKSTLRTIINNIAETVKEAQKFNIEDAEKLIIPPEGLAPELKEPILNHISTKGITLDAITYLVEKNALDTTKEGKELFSAACKYCDVSVLEYLHKDNKEFLNLGLETTDGRDANINIRDAFNNLCKNPAGTNEKDVLNFLLSQSNDIERDKSTISATFRSKDFSSFPARAAFTVANTLLANLSKEPDNTDLNHTSKTKKVTLQPQEIKSDVRGNEWETFSPIRQANESSVIDEPQKRPFNLTYIQELFEEDRAVSDVENHLNLKEGFLLPYAISEKASLETIRYLVEEKSIDTDLLSKDTFTLACKNCKVSVVEYLYNTNPSLAKSDTKINPNIAVAFDNLYQNTEGENEKNVLKFLFSKSDTLTKDAQLINELSSLTTPSTEAKDALTQASKLAWELLLKESRNVALALAEKIQPSTIPAKANEVKNEELKRENTKEFEYNI